MRSLPALAAALLVGSGCAAPPASSPPPAASAVPGTAAGGLPSAPPTPSPAPEAWTVTPTGLGPVRVGMTVPEAQRVLGSALVALDPEAPCYHVRWDGGPPRVTFMVIDGRIARVNVDAAPTATSAGARVGDSEARVEALYPGQVAVTPHKYTDGRYLTVTPAEDGHRIVFESDGERVLRYRAGRLPEVRWVEGCS
ncbi:MAG TPA: hypothetical protein VII13_06035 [Vicinamibacteria bacterium]|jgi:hypothetical protein